MPQGSGAAYDVVVVGAGPAGAMAALTAAEGGASVLLLERARLPRYKLCGGGLIGASLSALPASMRIPVRARMDSATFTFRGRWARTRRAGVPWLQMVNRADFDAALVECAVGAGAEVREGVRVIGLAEVDRAVRLETTTGPVLAHAVVGADGSASRVGRYVGVRPSRVDVGLEVEVPWPDPAAGDWERRLLLDWGPLPGSYGWVFPKGDSLTVGVIVDRRYGEAARGYLRDLLVRCGLAGAAPAQEMGHLTMVRASDSPLARGRVLVAGDAAGLLEPFTREGISYALRSGRLAGEAAAQLPRTSDPAAVGTAYRASVEAELGAECAAGAALYAAFAHRPAAFHAAIAALPPVWRLFQQFSGGNIDWVPTVERRAVRAALRLLSP